MNTEHSSRANAVMQGNVRTVANTTVMTKRKSSDIAPPLVSGVAAGRVHSGLCKLWNFVQLQGSPEDERRYG